MSSYDNIIQSSSDISKWNTTWFAHVACCNYNNGILFPEGNISLALNASSAEWAANNSTGTYGIQQNYKNTITRHNKGTLPKHIGLYVKNYHFRSYCPSLQWIFAINYWGITYFIIRETYTNYHIPWDIVGCICLPVPWYMSVDVCNDQH